MSSPPEYLAHTYTTGGYPKCMHQNTQNAISSLPTPTSLQIQVKAAAINPVDIQLMNLPIWSLPYLSSKEKGIGADFSGTILKSGPQSGFREGDEVMGLHMWPPGLGTLAEIMTVDTKNVVITKKPESWTHVQAASLPLVWLTARTCIDRVAEAMDKGHKSKGLATLVVLGGSSSTGQYVVRLAKKRGWKVIASCSAKNAEFVTQQLGTDEVVDYTSTSVPEAVQKVKPDAIVDCVGGTDCIGLSPRYVTIVGDKTSRSTMGGSALYLTSPRMVARLLLGRFGFGVHYDCIVLEQNKAWLEECTTLQNDDIAVDSVWKFEQAKEAFERLDTGRARGKVVVKIGSQDT